MIGGVIQVNELNAISFYSNVKTVMEPNATSLVSSQEMRNFAAMLAKRLEDVPTTGEKVVGWRLNEGMKIKAYTLAFGGNLLDYNGKKYLRLQELSFPLRA
jgi:hypothetical protein